MTTVFILISIIATAILLPGIITFFKGIFEVLALLVLSVILIGMVMISLRIDSANERKVLARTTE